MGVFQETILIPTSRAGTYEITAAVAEVVTASKLQAGTVTVFCQHTSCSLVVMENADPTARRDLERWLDRLVPENDPDFQHTMEGPDDMPSHIKMALTRTSEVVPISGGRMLLGTWQGLFLWEHRAMAHRRRILITVVGE